MRRCSFRVYLQQKLTSKVRPYKVQSHWSELLKPSEPVSNYAPPQLLKLQCPSNFFLSLNPVATGLQRQNPEPGP